MTGNELISVVVPVYNAEKFLRGTVQSIQAQTDLNYEIILVNDGSPDDSLSICRELETEDKRIRVIDQPNKGVSAARNAGIRAARGAFISFVDSDDFIRPTMIADLRRGMKEILASDFASAKDLGKNAPKVQVQLGREEVDEAGKRLPDAIIPPKEPVWIRPEEFTKSMLLYTGDASFCTKLTPRELLLEYPFEEGALAEDFGLQARLTGVLEGIWSLPQVDYCVVHRAGSLTRRKDIEHFSTVYISIVKAADYVEEELVPHYPDLAVPAKRFALIERLDYLLHVPIADMRKDNVFYGNVVQYLRENHAEIRSNPYLSRKNRVYLLLLSRAPRFVRRVHWVTMKVRGIR